MYLIELQAYNMNYNYYFYLLENYRKKMNPNLDILSIRKAVHQSYCNESLRQRQRYRHDMAKERRAKMESQKLMNWKIKELRQKEKEISQRYAHRNNYGNLIGGSKSMKSKTKEEPKDGSSIRVLLPVLKTKKDGYSGFASRVRNEGLDYSAYSIPKTMLPPENENISAYEVVKAAHEMCRKYGEIKQEDTGCDKGNGVRGGKEEKADKENLIMGPGTEDDKTTVARKKPVKRKINGPIEPQVIPLPLYRYGIDNGKFKDFSKQQNTSVYPKRNFEDTYEDLVNSYKKGEDLYEDGDRLASQLAVLGKANNTNRYELLIVDDGPRTEEIRVKQKCCSNPRFFDILIIREKLPYSPNTK